MPCLAPFRGLLLELTTASQGETAFTRLIPSSQDGQGRGAGPWWVLPETVGGWSGPEWKDTQKVRFVKSVWTIGFCIKDLAEIWLGVREQGMSELCYSGFQKSPSWSLLSQQSLCFFFVFVPEHRLGGSMGERRLCHNVLLTNWSLSILQRLYSFLHVSQNKTLSFENVVKPVQGHQSGLLVCSFLKDRLVKSRVSADGRWGTSLTYSLAADPIAKPREGPCLEAGSSHTCFQSPFQSCPLSTGAKDTARMARGGVWLRKTALAMVGRPSQAGESPSAHSCIH